MSKWLNLEQIEKQAWRSFNQDGLMDIFMGLILLCLAGFTVLDSMNLPDGARTALFIVAEMAAMGVLFGGRHFITKPRLGEVKFGKKRTKRRLAVVAVLTMSVLVGAFMAAYFARSDGSGLLDRDWVIAIVWMVNCMVVFGAIAYFLDYERMLIIGAVYAATLSGDVIFRKLWDIPAGPWLFTGGGLLILAMGIVIFVRFLNEHPIPLQEEVNAGS